MANRRLQEVLDDNRPAWAQEQGRTIEQARNDVLSAFTSLEQGIATLEEERALLAWLEPAPAEGPMDLHGGRLTHSGTLAAALLGGIIGNVFDLGGVLEFVVAVVVAVLLIAALSGTRLARA